MKMLIILLSLLSIDVNADLLINNSWVRKPPPMMSMTAAYLTLNNNSDKLITIKNITSAEFKSVEMHQSKNNKGVFTMNKLNSLELKPHSKIEFKPNSYHLMLISPKKSFNQLKQIHFQIQTNDNELINFTAPIK